MASADFLTFVVTMFRFEYVYSFSPTRPPRVSVTTFASYICCIYTLKFGQYWTSFCYGNSSVSSMPYMQFLFVRPRLCLRLPSDSTSRWTPLPLANSSYCQVCSGLSPPSDSACRAHILNTRSVFTLSGYLILSCPLLIFHRRPWRSIFLFKDERAICKVIISIIPEYICTACSESVHRV